MTDESSEGRGPIPENPQTGADASIPETPPAVSSPRSTVAPARTTTPKRVAVAVFKGLANVLSIALLIYLTYFFTMFFSTRPPAPAPVPESARVAAKKIEELRAEERQLLTTYGAVDPATKTVRIPIDRAMDLIVAEGGQPAPTPAAPPPPVLAVATPKAAGAATAAPKAGAALPVPKPAPVPAAAAPPPARVGMTAAQLYRAICIACHDADGRGTIVRKAMPTIPDFTDPKWEASHSNAEMIHTMLDGKGQFMLPMKDKFVLAHTDPKDMLAFMRSFQAGAPGVAPTATPTQTPAPSTPAPAIAKGATAPAAPSSPVPTGSAAPAPPAGPSAAALALANASPSPDLDLLLNPTPAPAPLSPIPPSVNPAPRFSSARTFSASTAPSPERAAKLRVAGEFYSLNCIACHGLDGRGSAIRIAMPVIPDFTTGVWQTSHNNPQLAVSILEGKGVLMPPWHGKVAPALAQDLVVFIRGFGPAGLVAANTTSSEFGSHFRQLQKQWQELDQQARALSRP